MRNKFHQFYQYSVEDYQRLWDEATFVFDANVLLNLYRYSTTTSNDFLEILKTISPRIWLPNQFAHEYHSKRLEVIQDIVNSYDTLRNEIEGVCKKQIRELISSYSYHPSIDIKSICTEIEKFNRHLRSKITRLKNKHPDLFHNDQILAELTRLFENKVGDCYPEEKIKKLMEEGAKRYAHLKPPGYEDVKKDKEDPTGKRKYGDLIAWYQIMEYAQKNKKSIILVTDDKKEDWWWIVRGKTVGPRCELIEEMKRNANVRFHMYNSLKFIEFAKKNMKQKIKRDTINEIKNVSEFSTQSINYVFPWMEIDKIPKEHTKILIEEIIKRISQDNKSKSLFPIIENINTIQKVKHCKECDCWYGTVEEDYGPCKLKHNRKDKGYVTHGDHICDESTESQRDSSNKAN